jgi:hypothetical protein
MRTDAAPDGRGRYAGGGLAPDIEGGGLDVREHPRYFFEARDVEQGRDRADRTKWKPSVNVW